MATKTKPAKGKTKSKPAGKRERTQPKYEGQGTSKRFDTAVATVAGMFKSAMTAAKMEMEDLAADLGISESRVRQLLDGRAVSLRTIVQVLESCGHSLEISARKAKA